MPIATDLTRRLGLTHPIFQAPMAGGATTPDLVTTVAEQGAMGFLGAAYLPPAQIVELARAVRSRTKRPFGINLFAPLPSPTMPVDAHRALERVAPYHAELGLAPPTLPDVPRDTYEECLQAALESGAAAFSFTFGMLPPSAVAAAKARGMLVVGTATTVEEAVALEGIGVDAVVAQGSEAGAHRGTHGTDFDAAMVGTMALVPQMVDAVRVPVIASGGIMDGRGIAAALVLGAQAVQMGTAFLTTEEAGIPEAHKAAIVAAREHETRLTTVFSGRPARGIINRFIAEMEQAGCSGTAPILPYPLQNALTRPVRGAAAKAGRADFLSLWAGQGVRLARRQAAAALVGRLAEEADEAVRSLAAAVER